MSDSKDNNAELWIIAIVGVIMVLGALDAFIKAQRTPSWPTSSSPSSSSYSNPTTYESTEDKLRRVYDSQGIQHDDQMIREDARAIEQLHREFGKEQ